MNSIASSSAGRAFCEGAVRSPVFHSFWVRQGPWAVRLSCTRVVGCGLVEALGERMFASRWGLELRDRVKGLASQASGKLSTSSCTQSNNWE